VAEDAIRDNVKAFIAAHIHSVVELECLLLLHGQPQREWSAEELGRELRVATEWAQRELLDLSARQLAVAVPGATPARYRYAGAGETHDTVQRLADAYARRRVTVTELIFSKPATPPPLQSFADAFKLRKGRQHDG
jgi:hypothetical protein